MAKTYFNFKHNRLEYIDVLKPDEDYIIEKMIGTTYSLDLYTVLMIFTTLGINIDDVLKGDIITFFNCILTFKDKVDIYCQKGHIDIPKRQEYLPLVALLDNCIHEVSVNDYSFHPKIWLVKYRNTKNNKVKYKFNVLSRNITSSHDFDVNITFNGEVSNSNSNSLGIYQFIKELNVPNYNVNELKKVNFMLDTPFDDVEFIPLGSSFNYVSDNLLNIPNIEKIVVISPFIDNYILNYINKRVLFHNTDSENMKELSSKIITTSMSLSNIDIGKYSNLDFYALIDDLFDYAPEDGEVTSRSIHAKMYLVYTKGKNYLIIGSANATRRGLENKNYEFVVKLTTSKSVLEQIEKDILSSNLFEHASNDVYNEKEKLDNNNLKDNLINYIKNFKKAEVFAINNIESEYILSIKLTSFPKMSEYEKLSIRPLLKNKYELVTSNLVNYNNPLSLGEISDFYVAKLEDSDGNYEEVVFKIDTYGYDYLKRDREINNIIIKTEEDVYKFINCALEDDYISYLLENREVDRLNSTYYGNSTIITPGLYEKLLSSSVSGYDKISKIEEVIDSINNPDIVKDELRLILKIFKEATKHGNRKK